MAEIKGNCTLTLSRSALESFLNDELIDYGVTSKLEVASIERGSTDASFMVLHLKPKSAPKSAPKPEGASK